MTSYFDTVRQMTDDPEILAAVDEAEQATSGVCRGQAGNQGTASYGNRPRRKGRR